jgi:hypothetical protein
MPRRRLPLIRAAALLAGMLAALPAAAAAAGDAAGTARVTYLSGPTVYVDAGREEGLLPGDAIQVVRDGQPIATLRVTYLSAHRAACSIASATAAPVVGDTVRYVTRRVAPAPAPGAPPGGPAPGGAAAPRRTRGGLFGLGLHGRAGLRYLEVNDRTGNGGGFSQPALDLRLGGYGLGGGPVDLLVDVRSRRTYRTLPSGANETDGENRVYRLSASYHLDARQQLVVGRQFAPSLAAVSIFDGVLYALRGTRTEWGVFTGVQPDSIDLRFSGDIQEHGAYVQFRGTPAERRRWTITTALIGSYTQSTVNREFLYLQGQYFGPRLAAFLAQEADYNRAWKVTVADESALSPTSTFASVRVRAGERLSFHAGYDNRRNVRLYRDRVTPETDFDDSHRQGAWAGATLRFGERWFTSADLRHSGGGAAGGADGYSASLGVDRLTRLHLGVRGRGTRYTNARSEGWLYSLGTGLDLGRRAHLELTAGRLQETNLVDAAFDRTTDWYDLDLDLLLGRSWYWLFSGERNEGDVEKNDQLYTALSYRF